MPRVREYVETWLLSRLKTNSRFRLTPAMNGLSSCAYFFELEGHTPLMLRWEDSAAAARRRLAGHRLFRKHGADAPIILLTDLRLTTRHRWGGCFLLEERLPGRPLSECDDLHATIDNLAVVFAQLHSNRCHPWRGGLNWSTRAKAVMQLKQPVERKIARNTHRMLQRYEAEGFPHRGEIERALAEANASAWRPVPRLCHGDPGATNVLACGDRIRLIDLAASGFQWAALDLAQIRHRLFDFDDELWGSFLDKYLAIAEEKFQRELEESLRLATLLWQLQWLLWLPPSMRVESDLSHVFDAVAAARKSRRTTAAGRSTPPPLPAQSGG